MPSDYAHHARFLTFSCYKRLPLFTSDRIKDAFVQGIRIARDRHEFLLHAWVIMPEHIHLVIRCHKDATVPDVLRTIKTGHAKRVLSRWKKLHAPILPKITDGSGRLRFWQRGGGYDRNIIHSPELPEKIQYIHANPVRRGLVSRPEEWAWSSARWWAGIRDNELECDQI